MALIESIVFPGGVDQCLTLFNEEWGRTLAIGDDWTRLRIGLLCSVEPNGASNIPTARLSVGMSSAANMHLGSAAAGLWYGFNVGGGSASLSGATWVYGAGGGNPYYHCDAFTRIRSLAGALSGTFNAGAASVPTTGGLVVRRWPVFVELEKVGTTMVVGAAMINLSEGDPTIRAAYSYTLADMILALEDGTLFIATGSNSVNIGSTFCHNLGSTTFAAHPTNAAVHGETDSVHIGWNKGAFGFRVYAVGVSRLEPTP